VKRIMEWRREFGSQMLFFPTLKINGAANVKLPILGVCGLIGDHKKKGELSLSQCSLEVDVEAIFVLDEATAF